MKRSRRDNKARIEAAIRKDRTEIDLLETTNYREEKKSVLDGLITKIEVGSKRSSYSWLFRK